MSYNKKYSETNVRLGLVRFSFPYLFKKRLNENGEPDKYSLCVIIPKADTETVKVLQDAINAAKEKGKTEKWGGKIPAKCKSPLRDGDIDREDDPAFKNCWFFNCSSKQAPGVRVREDGVITEALDESEVYAGCYGAVTVNCFPYNSNGNIGVGVGLNNVVKLEEGERLAGGRSADEDFADL